MDECMGGLVVRWFISMDGCSVGWWSDGSYQWMGVVYGIMDYGWMDEVVTNRPYGHRSMIYRRSKLLVISNDYRALLGTRLDTCVVFSSIPVLLVWAIARLILSTIAVFLVQFLVNFTETRAQRSLNNGTYGVFWEFEVKGHLGVT